MKHVLVISEAHLIKTFVLSTINRMKGEKHIRFDCFVTSPVDHNTFEFLQSSFDNVFVNKYPKGILKMLPKGGAIQNIYGLIGIARKLPSYDIVHIHYYYYYYSLFIPIIRRKAKLLFLTFFGSDFYKNGNIAHFITRRALQLVDRVFAINEVMLADVIKKYGLSDSRNRSGILIFLMSNFISFDSFLERNTVATAKVLWNFHRTVIVCGYSAGAIMRHQLIIDALEQIEDELDCCQIVFPMTYGWNGDENRARVKSRLKELHLDSVVLESFLPVERLQSLRLAADVFISIPSSDQLAASMMEHLAAGSIVITGKWLPYDGLVRRGVYFIAIDKPQDLTHVLPDVVKNLEFHRSLACRNREIVLSMMNWDTIKVNWYKYYNLN